MIGVTGANGLLGRFVLEGLTSLSIPFFGIKRPTSDISHFKDLSINWKDADILDFTSLQEAVKGATTIIHTAALVSFKPNDDELLYKTNVEGTRNLVNACLLQGVDRLIHISSVAALGRQKGVVEIDESHKWVDSKLNSEYAESKYLAELEVYRGQEEGLKIDIVNPSVILSQSDWDRSSSQLFKYVWRSRPFYIGGTINYVDVRDVVKIILSIIKSDSRGDRIIANAGALSLRDFLSEVAIRFNKKPPHILVPPSLVAFFAYLELIRSKITGKEPIVSPQSARNVNERFFYKNQKAIQELGIQFQPLEDTLDWCCGYYLKKMLQ
jgi:nucleoside-diphosphate-sugar epimerase